MKTILIGDRFYEVCPRCGPGAHCYLSGGDPRRCPERKDGLRSVIYETVWFDTKGKLRGDR